MNGSRDFISVFVTISLLVFTHQGHADDRGKLPAEPLQDGSVSKTVLKADQGGENLLKSTAWQALDKGYRAEGERILVR